MKRRLTWKETQAVKFIASGKPQKIIAAELNMSVHTLDAALQRAYRKLRINSNVEATHYALHKGLIENIFLNHENKNIA